MPITENVNTPTSVITPSCSSKTPRLNVLFTSPTSHPDKFRFSGDVSVNTLYTPRSANNAICVCKLEIDSLRKEKRNMSLTIQRLKNKVEHLNQLLKDLKKKERFANSLLKN